jgi:hypothetical protein
VAAAAASVWHEAHADEPVNTALPAAVPLAGAPEGAPDFAGAAPLLDVADAPGTPGWAAFGGGTPIGGVAFAGWELTQD